MQIADVSFLGTQVLWAGFLLSAIFGAIGQRTHFCTMGAVSDIVTMNDWSRMKQWVLAMGIALVGFSALAYFGLIDPTKTLYASNRWMWLSAGIGGLMFGFGMVLASGCGSKTLVRIGGGSLKSLTVFLVMAVAAFATLKGMTAVARVATVDKAVFEFGTDAALAPLLAVWLSMDPLGVRLMLGLMLGGGLILWTMWRKEFRIPNNLIAGLGMGTVIVAAWWVSGSLGHIAEHPETLQETYLTTNSGRAESLSFVSPMAYTLDWIQLFSDKGKVLTFGIVSVLGVVAGSAAWAVTFRTFRWEGFGGTEDLANHLIGGVLMGVGGVTAMGCTIGQGLSGISTLSATSFVALISIMTGAVAALKFQIRRLTQID